MVVVDGLNFEGCACPWCGMVVVLPIEYNDHSVIGICSECGKMYKAIPHPKYSGGVLLLKYRMGENLYGW